jgi:hypothetical protein
MIAICLFAYSGHAVAAEQDIGKVVALRGKAAIEREGAQLNIVVGSALRANDLITTAADSRTKLVFIDDSILTVGENSRLKIKEFLYSKGKQGKSIYNLLEGKMHSVVGHTKFEVQTPTAVAAARGTIIYFEVGTGESK